MDKFSGEWARLGSAIVRKVKLGNALDVLLVLAIFMGIGSIVSFTITGRWEVLLMGGVPIVILGVAYVYFMLKDPNMLRSEEHQETMYRLSIGLGEKGKELNEAKIVTMESVDIDEAKVIGEGGGSDEK